VLIALQSGIDGFDDLLLSVHMVQHLLLLLAPLLLLAGRPVILALRALSGERRRALARAISRGRPVTSPVACLAIFDAVLLVTHLPSFYDAELRDDTVHEAEHALYLFAGLLLWWPILDGDPVPSRRLGGLGRLIYLLAAIPPMALVGAYLTRHASLVYPAYEAPARALGVSALVDQAQAGAIMRVAGGSVMAAVGLWASIAALVGEEREQQARDARLGSTAIVEPRTGPGMAP
jgi:putative membrane protein